MAPVHSDDDMHAAVTLADHGARIETLEERSDRTDKQLDKLITQTTRTEVIVQNLLKLAYIIASAAIVAVAASVVNVLAKTVH